MENTLRMMTQEETKVMRKNSGPSFSSVTNITKGKSMINHLFQHLKYERKVKGFFLVHVEISIMKVQMENTLRVITPEETKVTRKNSGPSFSSVTNVT